ncbi:MAG: hypothetical protein D6720_04595 [Gammaproteobacteria bacterium]|nr:MAG: hypothetical protein D6720_04595 [Gammaproteobacteria bacterium]
MYFTALAVAPLPDVETARQNFDLQGLSDEDVAKVLFHRRKQRVGSEQLDWDQLTLGAVSMVRFGSEQEVHIESFSVAEFPELMLLDAVFQMMQTAPPLVTWGGRRQLMPLLQFRCLKHRRAIVDYWARFEDRRDPHLDLQLEWLPQIDRFPSLDDMARRLGLPGMLGLHEAQLWEQWLAGDHEALLRYGETAAINTGLLALEIFHLQGRYALGEVDGWRQGLRDVLRQTPRHATLLRAWESQP